MATLLITALSYFIACSKDDDNDDTSNTIKQVVTGNLHTCAIIDNNTVKCWGLGNNGSLGYGNTNDIGDDETPDSIDVVNFGTGRTAKQIAAGSEHTCAVLDNNTVKCWGNGGAGRLGYGNTNDIGDDETPDSIGVVNLGTGRTAKQIAAGGEHTCAVLDNNTVKCWGLGNNGRLGYGNTNDIGDDETPDNIGVVNLGTGRTAKQIAAGGEHTCAVLDNDTVRCWGNGGAGRLGYGNTNDIGDDETPDSIGVVNLGIGRNAEQITTGNLHTCAMLDDDSVKCWGLSDNGRLGYGNTNDIGDDETPDSIGVVNLGIGRTAKQVAAGGEHTCAVLDDDSLKCWGLGNNGRLGYGNINNIGDNETPDTIGIVSLESSRTTEQIATGDEHTCAMLSNNSVKCWGNGNLGRLGYGNTNDIGDDETPDSIGTINL